MHNLINHKLLKFNSHYFSIYIQLFYREDISRIIAENNSFYRKILLSFLSFKWRSWSKRKMRNTERREFGRRKDERRLWPRRTGDRRVANHGIVARSGFAAREPDERRIFDRRDDDRRMNNRRRISLPWISGESRTGIDRRVEDRRMGERRTCDRRDDESCYNRALELSERKGFDRRVHDRRHHLIRRIADRRFLQTA